MRKNILSSRVKQKRPLKRFKVPISIFSIVLFTLAILINIYHLHTRQFPNCEFAVNWIGGWFTFSSPFQLFAVSFFLALIIWLVRVFAFWRECNIIETLAQGIFILGFAFYLAILHSMLFPYSPPTHDQITSIADKVSPLRLTLEYENTNQSRPPWPYNFPPPPRRPDWTSWFAGYNPSLNEIFLNPYSPTPQEYNNLYQCAVRYRQRAQDQERGTEEYFKWYNEYGNQVDPQYLRARSKKRDKT